MKRFLRTLLPVSSVPLPPRLPPLPGPADAAEAPSRTLVVAAIVLLHGVVLWALLRGRRPGRRGAERLTARNGDQL